MPLRFGVFALSLLGIVWALRGSRSGKVPPSWILLVIAAAYMAIMLAHPATNTIMAGLAQIGMHLAVAAPLLWAPAYFRCDERRLARVLTILGILNGASAVVGILQVRNPGMWMPAEFTSTLNIRFLAMYQYRAGDGSLVIRPPGLGDSPGAACGAGMFAALMGLGYLGLPVPLWKKMLGLAMGVAGILAIFLSHVRSFLIVVVGSALVYWILMVRQKRFRAALTLACGAALCGFSSLYYAAAIGGQSTVDRFATLLNDDASVVYGKSGRKYLLIDTFDTLLVEHPLGAGLGRWGMMRGYFGTEDNPDSPSIWAEIQFSSWALDGGVVLMSLYLIALVLAIWRLVWASLFHPSQSVRQWGAMIIMLSAGPIALLFSWVPFYSQMGMQFWFLIGAFEGLAQGAVTGRLER